MSEQKHAMPKARSWPKILLIVSLTFNLLFVGLVAGALWRMGPHAKHDRGDRLIPLVMALPKAERDALRSEFREWVASHHQQQNVGPRDRMQQLLVVLRDQPFDAEALRKHFEERVNLHEQQLQIGRDALIVRIIGLSDVERAAYADRLERRARRWRGD